MGELKYISGRVIVEVDIEKKNSHKFQDGTEIRLERKYNEFNRRITEPVNATVISAEHIPSGSEILIGHNSLHDTNKIFNFKPLSGEAIASDIKYFSLPEEDCFAWRDENNELQPMKDFCFALRVFKPYKGILEGIEPTEIKNVLYITTGYLNGKVVHTLKASDYEIIYQGLDGREARVIRCRHFQDEDNEKEEIVAISGDLTKQVNSGKLLVGLSKSDCKAIK